MTIPEAYNCGHDTLKGQGHGMHRLTTAGYVAFASWDPVSEDALWSITGRGRETLEELLDSVAETPGEPA